MKNWLVLFLVILFAQLKSQCWQSISSGNNVTRAIAYDGSLWAWGSNSINPVQVGNSIDWKSVSTGDHHTLLLKTDGTLWSWGNQSFGELGNGNQGDNLSPTQVGTSTNWKSIAAGSCHSMAIKTDGTLWAWGQNYARQLGAAIGVSVIVPTSIGSSWSFVSTGDYYTFGIKTDGSLWAFGSNVYGELGTASTYSCCQPMAQVPGIWKYVVGSASNSSGIKTDGTLWSWGSGLTNTNSPMQVDSDQWQTISVRNGNSMGIKSDGTLWTWGGNINGELGDGTFISKSIPNQIMIGHTFQNANLERSPSYNSSFAIEINGTVWAFGNNQYGQLGIGSLSSVGINTPVKIVCPDVGIKENSMNPFSLEVYPNPSSEKFIFDIKEKIDNANIVFTNSLGEKIYEAKISSGKNEMKINDIPAGVYYYYLNEDGYHKIAGKIVVKY